MIMSGGMCPELSTYCVGSRENILARTGRTLTFAET